jgi:hypothetical protein
VAARAIDYGGRPDSGSVMFRPAPRMPRHSTIAAYLALFLALGGTSYAVVNLPRNSVGAGELRKNAVRSSDVKNRSLKAIDFQRGSFLKGTTSAPGSTPVPAPAPPDRARLTTTKAFPRPSASRWACTA